MAKKKQGPPPLTEDQKARLEAAAPDLLEAMRYAIEKDWQLKTEKLGEV